MCAKTTVPEVVPVVSTTSLPTGLTAESASCLADNGFPYLEVFVRDIPGWEEGAVPKDLPAWLKHGPATVWSVHFAGVDLSSPHRDQRLAGVEEAKRQILMTADLGAELAVIHASQSFLPGERALRKENSRRALAELVCACSRAGIRLAVETMAEFKTDARRAFLGFPAQEVVELLDGCDPDTVGVCVDVNHVNLAEDPAEVVRQLQSRLLSLHISDNDGAAEMHMLPFRGVINWPGLLATLSAIGYSGGFVYESNPPDPDLQRSVEILAENWAEMKKMWANAPSFRS